MSGLEFAGVALDEVTFIASSTFLGFRWRGLIVCIIGCNDTEGVIDTVGRREVQALGVGVQPRYSDGGLLRIRPGAAL